MTSLSETQKPALTENMHDLSTPKLKADSEPIEKFKSEAKEQEIETLIEQLGTADQDQEFFSPTIPSKIESTTVQGSEPVIKHEAQKLDDEAIIRSLEIRDKIENNFSSLFISEEKLRTSSFNTGKESNSAKNTDEVLEVCKAQLLKTEKRVSDLKDITEAQKKEIVHLQDEMLSMNIENNLLHKELETIRTEYDKLVARWIAKTQQDADMMNATLH